MSCLNCNRNIPAHIATNFPGTMFCGNTCRQTYRPNQRFIPSDMCVRCKNDIPGVIRMQFPTTPYCGNTCRNRGLR